MTKRRTTLNLLLTSLFGQWSYDDEKGSIMDTERKAGTSRDVVEVVAYEDTKGYLHEASAVTTVDVVAVDMGGGVIRYFPADKCHRETVLSAVVTKKDGSTFTVYFPRKAVGAVRVGKKLFKLVRNKH